MSDLAGPGKGLLCQGATESHGRVFKKEVIGFDLLFRKIISAAT